MTIETTPPRTRYNWDHEQVAAFNQRAEEVALEITRSSNEAARRIAAKIKAIGWQKLSYLNPYFRPEASNEELYVTDHPELVFEELLENHSNKIYTITSSLTLESQTKNGVLLSPPFLHDRYSENISTHRGGGLALFSRLMVNLGIGLSAKDLFVWAGPKIDGEQFVIEENIAQAGERLIKNC